MTNLTEWKNRVLIPALMQRADRVWPDMRFVKRGQLWQSPLNRDGSRPSEPRVDRTVILDQKALIHENSNNTDRALSFVDWEMTLGSYTRPVDAMRALAERAGVPFPELNPEAERAYLEERQRRTVLDEAAEFFHAQLSTAPEAEAVRHYLTNVRGYNLEQWHERGIRLGFVPDRQRIREHLRARGLEPGGFLDTLTADVGKSHVLSIPWVSEGEVLSFKFRTLESGPGQYTNSRTPRQTLFNVGPLREDASGHRELVLVEGELDALHARAQGLRNVVALGGSSITAGQVQQAKALRVTRFTLCLDLDTIKDAPEASDEDRKAKRLSTAAANERKIREVLPSAEVFLGELEEALPKEQRAGKVDLDTALRHASPSEVGRVIDRAEYLWKLETEAEVNALAARTFGVPSDKDVANLRAALVRRAAPLNLPEAEHLLEHFLSVTKSQGMTMFSRETLRGELLGHKEKAEAEREHAEAAKAAEDHRKAAADQARTLGRQIEEGNLEAAERGLSGIRESLVSALPASGLIYPITREELSSVLSRRGDALPTGFPGLDEVAQIPRAALTVVFGRVAHGKTTLLLNLALNAALEERIDKTVHFVSYEESRESILLKVLNALLSRRMKERGDEDEVKELERNRVKVWKRSNAPKEGGAYTHLRRYFSHGCGDLKDYRSDSIEQAWEELHGFLREGRLNITDREGAVGAFGAKLRRLPEDQRGPVFVDHAQVVPIEDGQLDTRRKIMRVTQELMRTATDSGLSIILGAQANRVPAQDVGFVLVKEGSEKKSLVPLRALKLEHLKESGSLEEDANLVLSIWNPAREPQFSEWGESNRSRFSADLVAVTALKNRDGESNRMTPLLLRGDANLLEDLSEDQKKEAAETTDYRPDGLSSRDRKSMDLKLRGADWKAPEDQASLPGVDATLSADAKPRGVRSRTYTAPKKRKK